MSPQKNWWTLTFLGHGSEKNRGVLTFIAGSEKNHWVLTLEIGSEKIHWLLSAGRLKPRDYSLADGLRLGLPSAAVGSLLQYGIGGPQTSVVLVGHNHLPPVRPR